MFSRKNNDALVDSLQAHVDVLEQEVEQLKAAEAAQKKRMAALDLRLQTVESALSDRRNEEPAGVQSEAQTANGKAMENHVGQNEISEFYLPAPTPDGVFEEASASKQVGKSIYLLKTKDQENGTFSILEDKDSIATAMISVSQFIKPVCRIEGDTHRYPQRVTTLEEGVVRKEGNSWHLVAKAKLLFEDR